MAEDVWNTRDPEKVAPAYAIDSRVEQFNPIARFKVQHRTPLSLRPFIARLAMLS